MRTYRIELRIAAVILLAICVWSTPAQITTSQISYKTLFNQNSDQSWKNDQDEVQAIIKVLGAGGIYIYPSEVTAHLKKNFPEINQKDPIKLYAFVHENMITSGKDYERLQKVITPLLQFCWLEGKVFPILYKSEQPVVAITYPKALIFSTRVLALLDDEELAAQAAHELSHLILQSEYEAAIKSKNNKTLRRIELFCDAACAAIIATRGKDPSKLITGLQKQQQVLELEYGETGRSGDHPSMATRERLNKELIRQFKLTAEPNATIVSINK